MISYCINVFLVKRSHPPDSHLNGMLSVSVQRCTALRVGNRPESIECYHPINRRSGQIQSQNTSSLETILKWKLWFIQSKVVTILRQGTYQRTTASICNKTEWRDYACFMYVCKYLCMRTLNIAYDFIALILWPSSTSQHSTASSGFIIQV